MSAEKLVIVFRTRLRPEFATELPELGMRMYQLAVGMTGFISYKDFTADDGENVTLVEFDTAEHLAAWRNHPEHVAAQKAGRERYFSWYQIQVCQIQREYEFEQSHPS